MEQEYLDFIETIIKANQYINPSNPLNGNLVNDYLYEVNFLNNKVNYINNPCGSDLSTYNNSNKHETIIIVLESPHKDEFDSNGNGIEPLIKRKSFEKKLFDAINNSVNLKLKLQYNKTYNLILMNTIQYQCSLGVNTEYYRDYVFLYYFNKCEEEFKNRLLKYLKTFNVISIVNLCTEGSHVETSKIRINNNYFNTYKSCGPYFFKKVGFTTNAKNLQDIVENSINSVAITYTCKRSTGVHPSAWLYHSNKSKYKLIK